MDVKPTLIPFITRKMEGPKSSTEVPRWSDQAGVLLQGEEKTRLAVYAGEGDWASIQAQSPDQVDQLLSDARKAATALQMPMAIRSYSDGYSPKVELPYGVVQQPIAAGEGMWSSLSRKVFEFRDRRRAESLVDQLTASPAQVQGQGAVKTLTIDGQEFESVSVACPQQSDTRLSLLRSKDGQTSIRLEQCSYPSLVRVSVQTPEFSYSTPFEPYSSSHQPEDQSMQTRVIGLFTPKVEPPAPPPPPAIPEEVQQAFPDMAGTARSWMASDDVPKVSAHLSHLLQLLNGNEPDTGAKFNQIKDQVEELMQNQPYEPMHMSSLGPIVFPRADILANRDLQGISLQYLTPLVGSRKIEESGVLSFANSDLRGADLRMGATSAANDSKAPLTHYDFTGAIYNSKTILPRGLDPKANGMVLRED